MTPLVPLHHNSSRLAACQQTLPRVWAGRWWHLLLLLLLLLLLMLMLLMLLLLLLPPHTRQTHTWRRRSG